MLTSDVPFLSSVHGRQRREERDIDQHDLRAAVLHGKKEDASRVVRGRRRQRWKYTFANIVYITDEASTTEVTSWVEPVRVDPVPVSPTMLIAHEAACKMVCETPQAWTSHTVLVIDQSGSMRKADMRDCANRADAVWVCLALDWIGPQLETGEAKATDVVSVVSMNAGATVLLKHKPVDWLLYNKLLHFRDTLVPRSHGHYIPALDTAEELLSEHKFGGCALQLMFLSDGRPSDRVPGNPADGVEWRPTEDEKDLQEQGHIELTCQRVGELASRFGRRLTLGTIGLGASRGDFEVLKKMTEAAAEYGTVATFKMPSLTSTSLGLAMTSLASSLTDTRTEMTEIGGSKQRVVKDVQRDRSGVQDDDVNQSAAWWFYEDTSVDFVSKRLRWSEDAHALVPVAKYQTPQAQGIAYRKAIMPDGEGAERMVHKFREIHAEVINKFRSPVWSTCGMCYVAKESRFADSEDKKPEFHRVFCETQARAQRFADVFNKRVSALSAVTCANGGRIPLVKFLDCSVYVLQDANQGEFSVLVEEMLDGSYQKWNNNKGHVKGQDQDEAKRQLDELEEHMQGLTVGDLDLGAIAESDEEEEEEDSEEDDNDTDSVLGGTTMPAALSGVALPPTVSDADVPQAFTHFTHRYSKRKQMVCDLQGVLDESVSPPVFKLTDPVIHYRSEHGRKNVYGRTDHGVKGMDKFFATHECNALCRLLKMPGDERRWKKNNPKAKGASAHVATVHEPVFD
jgi:hypothetical protein